MSIKYKNIVSPIRWGGCVDQQRAHQRVLYEHLTNDRAKRLNSSYIPFEFGA
jgi:hypothetical protein